MKRVRFPIAVKRGSSEVKIYRDRKPEGTYYRVTYYLGSKRHRLNFSDLKGAIEEAEAKASQLSRGDMDAVQVSKKDRDELGRAREVIRKLLRDESGFDSLITPDGREKSFDLPLDTVA